MRIFGITILPSHFSLHYIATYNVALSMRCVQRHGAFPPLVRVELSLSYNVFKQTGHVGEELLQVTTDMFAIDAS